MNTNILTFKSIGMNQQENRNQAFWCQLDFLTTKPTSSLSVSPAQRPAPHRSDNSTSAIKYLCVQGTNSFSKRFKNLWF